MEYKYILVSSIFCSDNIIRTGYGIAWMCEHDGVAVNLQSISDISSDKSCVEQLVDKCNRLRLSPFHLSDAVDDFLANL